MLCQSRHVGGFGFDVVVTTAVPWTFAAIVCVLRGHLFCNSVASSRMIEESLALAAIARDLAKILMQMST